MALRIPCPNCGPRSVGEFRFGGEVPRADEPDLERIWLRTNAEGRTTERWYHELGCRRWLTLDRDTRTNTVLEHGGIELRHAEPADYGPLIASLDAWWGGRRMTDMVPALFFSHFRPTSFVAWRDDERVGFLVGFRSQSDPAQAYVHFVGVAPELRGHGVGRRLYERFFAAARALGCHEVLAVTSPRNPASIAFHRELGFALQPGDAEVDGVPFRTDYDGPGEDRVRFRRAL